MTIELQPDSGTAAIFETSAHEQGNKEPQPRYAQTTLCTGIVPERAWERASGASIEEAQLDDHATLKITIEKPSRSIVWVDPSQAFRYRRIEHYSSRGVLFSIAEASDYRPVDGVPFPFRHTLREFDQNGQLATTTTISVQRASINKPLDEREFAVRLPRGTRLSNLIDGWMKPLPRDLQATLVNAQQLRTLAASPKATTSGEEIPVNDHAAPATTDAEPSTRPTTTKPRPKANAANEPAGPEEAQLDEDMRRWYLDLHITGSPSPGQYTEAELEAYAELDVRRHVVRLKKAYQLTPEQEKVVRQRLEEMKTAFQSYWKKNQPELKKLIEQRKLISAGRGYDTLDNQRDELRERYNRLIAGHPLDSNVVNAEIEELLPQDQVAAARERANIASAARLAQLQSPFDLDLATTRPAPIVQLRDLASNPFRSWRRYINLFINAYDLDDDQQAKAEAILDEFENRRDDYQESHEAEFIALRDTRGLEMRFRKGEELRAPIVKMYEEMLGRLQKIPTATQRQAADREADAAKMPAGGEPQH